MMYYRSPIRNAALLALLFAYHRSPAPPRAYPSTPVILPPVCYEYCAYPEIPAMLAHNAYVCARGVIANTRRRVEPHYFRLTPALGKRLIRKHSSYG